MSEVAGISNSRKFNGGGNARVRFALSPDNRTYIAEQLVAYPFHITRPFYLQDDPPGMPSLYLQSVSGGVFEGDKLNVDIDVGPGGAAHVTTQASTVVHRMERGRALQTTHLKADADSLLEFVPDPMVLFPLARLTNQIKVVCAVSATVMVSDAFLSHDPQGGDAPFSDLHMQLAIERPDGTPVALDRFEITGETLAKHNRYCAHGSFVCVTPRGAPKILCEQLHAALNLIPDCYAGVSALPHDAGIWMRVVAENSHALRAAIETTWSGLRTELSGTVPRRRPK